ncbi:MAG TPA: 3D domain-containing protein [Chloroflexota bacterium]
MNRIPRAFPPHHRPVLVLAALLGLLLWGCLFLLGRSTASQAERVVAHAASLSREPRLGGNPARAAGGRMIPTLPGSPPVSPSGMNAKPGLGESPPLSPPGRGVDPNHRDSPPPARVPSPPAHTLRAWVTGYDLTGITASGVPAGPGGCAVDPSVVPLGTTITIDGIGRCRANDTGGAVMGAMVDVWVSDARTAYQLTGGYTIHW